jgi:flagellar M-ring protein FliF
MERFRTMFAGFTGGQKAVTAIAVLAVMVGGAMFATWVTKPTYAPLFTGLSSTDASAITAKLTEAKTPYQLSEGGQTILVPQADVYQERINLSGQGLPAGGGGGDGYSLLDKQSMTSSDFQQKVTYQRALEGELRKTIEAIDGVQTAVVHLAIPEVDVFTDSASKATASVLVKTDATTPLKSAQVEAIVHLVSSSVPKLAADQVTVADASGRVLNAAGDNGGASAMSDARAAQTQGFEADTANAVQTMLDKLVGPGHAVTRVDASLNFDQQTTDKQEYIADKKTPPLTDSITKETYKGAGGTPVGGVLGPDNNAVPSGTAGSSDSNYVKVQEQRANAVGTLKTTTTSATGQPSRVSVAVVLDQLTAGSINDVELTKLVTAAAGLDTKRGDVVTVSKMPFDTKAAALAKKELDAAAADQKQADLINMGKTGALVLLSLLALLIAVKKGRRVERTAVDIGELSAYRDKQGALEASARQVSLESANALPAAADSQAVAQVDRQAVARQEIGTLIEQQPDEVARLLRGWLADRRT